MNKPQANDSAELDPRNTGLRGVGRVMRINLGVLALYLIPCLLIVALGEGQTGIRELAAGVVFVVPIAHGLLSLIIGLVALLTQHRDTGAGLMISGPIILIIAFSTCLGTLSLLEH